MPDIGPLLARNSNDAGARGGASPSSVAARADYLHNAPYRFFTSTLNGSVSGSVKEGGVPVAGRTVRAYDEITGELLGQTTSAGDGSFSLSALGRPTVYVVAFDYGSGFNALIFDHVTPV